MLSKAFIPLPGNAQCYSPVGKVRKKENTFCDSALARGVDSMNCDVKDITTLDVFP